MSQAARLKARVWSATEVVPARQQTLSRSGSWPSRRSHHWSHQKSRFAFELFVVQILAIGALQTVLQLHITHELAQTTSIDTANLLRALFFDSLRTLTWVGPVIALLSVLVALRLANRFTASSERVGLAMRQLADGDPGVRLRLRAGDALAGMEPDFNRLAELLTQRRRERGGDDVPR